MKIKYGIKYCLISIFLLLFISCALLVIPPIERKGELEEEIIKEAKHFYTTNRILVVDVSGFISLSERKGLFGKESSVAEMKDILEKAADDDAIKAIVLRINTPGGEVTATDIIYNDIMEFKEKRLKEGESVVVSAALMELAASGGFYIAQSADRIYALNTTILGNIGVIAVFPKIQGLANKIGYESRVIKSGPYKDIGSPFRDFTPEETKIFNDIIQSEYSRFVDVVAANRYQLSREQVLKLADGRVFSAVEAYKAGLIDGIGYFEQIIEHTKKLAGIKDAEIFMYKRPGEYKSNIYSLYDKPAIEQFNLLNINFDNYENFRSPKFMYLWQP